MNKVSKNKNPQWTPEEKRLSYDWSDQEMGIVTYGERSKLILEEERLEKLSYSLIDQEKWIEFSEIQCASNLVKEPFSVARFKQWLDSGDDDDAWS